MLPALIRAPFEMIQYLPYNYGQNVAFERPWQYLQNESEFAGQCDEKSLALYWEVRRSIFFWSRIRESSLWRLVVGNVNQPQLHAWCHWYDDYPTDKPLIIDPTWGVIERAYDNSIYTPIWSYWLEKGQKVWSQAIHEVTKS